MSIPRIPYATAYRTHTCGQLRAADVGKEVKLSGAVHAYLGDDNTFDLRDSYGMTRVVFQAGPVALIEESLNFPETPKEQRAKRLSDESVIAVSGVVRERKQPDAQNATGEIYLDASKLEILAPSKPNLIFHPFDEKVTAADKRRHRYVSLRNTALQESLRFRARLSQGLRRFLFERQFLDVQTPVLAQRWSPAMSEAFLAVRKRKDIFALQGHRSNVGELFMASGFDRTFELARRFAKKTQYGPFEQPEYTVLEANIGYFEEGDLLGLVTHLLEDVGRKVLGDPIGAVPRISYADALAKYGTDTPDLRLALPFFDLAKSAEEATSPKLRQLIGQNAVRFLRAPGDVTLDVAPIAAGLGSGGFVDRIAVTPERTAQLAKGAALDQVAADEAVLFGKAEPGEALFAVSSKDANALIQGQGALRTAAGKSTGPSRRNAFVIVTRLPYFRWDAQARRHTLQGDPLAKAAPGELDGAAHEARALAFSVVLNGVQVGGGSVRNADLGPQRELFDALGLSAADVSARYGAMLEAFRFGVAPHARLVLGVDRLAALLRGLDSLDDVIAMPKNPDGSDGLARSPSRVGDGIVRGFLGS